MTIIFKTYSWLFLPLLLLSGLKSSQSKFTTISHEITLSHPGEEVPVNSILEEIKNQDGLTIEYAMDVYSVICLKGVCKVIPVKLFWTPTGIYKKYELAKGETLEKYEADLFEPEDYIKLQSILSDSNSPFKEVYYDEILSAPDQHGDTEDLDAVSGATALELDEKDTVPGAALTCFTLWHWANGNVVAKIKEFTGLSASNEQLKDFIVDDNDYFKIALVELQKRELYSEDFIDMVIQKILVDDTVLRISGNYFKEAPTDKFLYTVQKLFVEGDKEHKLLAMKWLRETSKEIPNAFLDDLSAEINNLNSYQEISFLLGLLESKNHQSELMIDNIILLLNNDFIVARRAYWFLKNQHLNDNHTKKLEAFYIKNKDRL